MKDLTGQQFNRLTVLSKDKEVNHKYGYRYWLCKCSCGKYKSVGAGSLTSGDIKSCGCLRSENAKNFGKHRNKKVIDISGLTINNVNIVRMSNRRTTAGGSYCFAICPSCLLEWEVNTASLKSKRTTQCKKCALSQYSSKTATILLDKLEKILSLRIIREYRVEDKFFDGYVPSHNILIESDGSYWHSSKKAKIADKEKSKLAKKLGYEIIRVINNNQNDHRSAIQKVKKYING